MASDKVRSLAMARWRASGKPRWSVAQTVDVAVEVDRSLEERGLNPAPRFREHRTSDDRLSMRAWVLGTRFPWLQGRRGSEQAATGTNSNSGGTSNRRLTPTELGIANSLLDLVRSRIDEFAGDDARLRFAYKRKIAKELQYDERGKPIHRIRLKQRKRRAQNEMCANGALAPHRLPAKGAILDRFRAEDGYTDENTRLLCPNCDAQLQAEKGYTDLAPEP